MDGSTTLREAAAHMREYAVTPLAKARRQRSWAKNAVRRVERQMETERARLDHWNAEVARLEAEQRAKAVS